MNPQLANMIAQLGLDPAFVMSPQGVQVLQLVSNLAAQQIQAQVQPGGSSVPGRVTGPPPRLPASGAEEFKRVDPYGVV